MRGEWGRVRFPIVVGHEIAGVVRAVGAGVTGGAVFALTAWIALAAMWVGAIVTHLAIDGVVIRPLIAEPSIQRADGR